MDIEEQRRRYQARPDGMSLSEWYRRLSLLGLSVGEIARMAGKPYQPVYNTVKAPGTEAAMAKSKEALEMERQESSTAVLTASDTEPEASAAPPQTPPAVRGYDELWKRAEDLFGNALDDLVAEALSKMVDSKEMALRGFERLVLPVRYGSYNGEDIEERQPFDDVADSRPIAFFGRIVFQHEITYDDTGSHPLNWRVSVYVTPKDKLVFYHNCWPMNTSESEGTATYRVFASLEDATKEKTINTHAQEEPLYWLDLIVKVAEALGQAWVVELDV